MAKAKPGTPHPTKRGMVMGKNGRYVAKSTYNKQVKAAKSKPVAKAPQKALPPAGKSSGSQRRFQAQDKAAASARGTKGTGTRTGGTSNLARYSALAKKSKLAGAGRALGAAGLAINAYQNAKGLSDSLQRGEGLAKLARKGTTQGKGTKGSQGGSRAAVTRKPKPTSKPKREVTSRNRRGRPTSYAKPVKPAKRGMSNIPPQEGTGRGSPNNRKPAKRQNAAPKPKVKKGSGVSGVGPVASGRAYSVAKTGKSVSRQRVDELRAMRERSKKRQAEMKKKKK